MAVLTHKYSSSMTYILDGVSSGRHTFSNDQMVCASGSVAEISIVDFNKWLDEQLTWIDSIRRTVSPVEGSLDQNVTVEQNFQSATQKIEYKVAGVLVWMLDHVVGSPNITYDPRGGTLTWKTFVHSILVHRRFMAFLS